MGKKLRTLQPNQTNKIVVSTAEEVTRLIKRRVNNIAVEQQWLLMSRVVNLVFAGHFYPIIQSLSFSRRRGRTRS
jgi:hypothetical protein